MKRNRFIKIILSMMLLLVTKAFSIEITPSTFVYKLDGLGLTQDVVFYNRKDRPERVKVSFKPYNEDKDEKYLGKWGTIFPKIVTIGPDQQKTVKFSIEPPSGLPNGEYRALLFMEELEQKSLNNVEGKVVLKNGSTTQINMLINLGVVVYGYVGDPESLKVSGKVTNLKNSSGIVSFELENDGEITKPYKLIFEGTDKKTGEFKAETKDIVVVQGYKEKISEKYPKDLNVNKIYLKDSKDRKIQDIK